MKPVEVISPRKGGGRLMANFIARLFDLILLSIKENKKSIFFSPRLITLNLSKKTISPPSWLQGEKMILNDAISVWLVKNPMEILEISEKVQKSLITQIRNALINKGKSVKSENDR